MKLWSLALGFAFVGCAGVQGGTEGNESGDCEYERRAVDTVEAPLDGFEETPAVLLGRAERLLVGTTQGHAVEIAFEARPDQVTALYDVKEPPLCGPHLDAAASATIRLEDSPAATVSERAGLEVRWGKHLGMARFEAAPGSALAQWAPDFSGTLVGSPVLQIWLEEMDAPEVTSTWRWSAQVACDEGEQCAGGPSVGESRATTGEEIDWGYVTLTPASR